MKYRIIFTPLLLAGMDLGGRQSQNCGYHFLKQGSLLEDNSLKKVIFICSSLDIFSIARWLV